MVDFSPLVAQVRFFVTPRFLLRGSYCSRKLLVASHFVVPVEDSDDGSMWVIFGHSAVLQRKVASPSRYSNSGL